VLYTPNAGFVGTDQFEYTIEDTRGIRSRARVTVRVGATETNDIIALRLDVTDLSGTPITDIAVGGQFQLRGFVQDLRGAGIDRGVFAAYQDVLYSSNLVRPVSSTTNPLGFQVTFGPNYPVLTSGGINTLGLINEIGAVQRTAPDGSASALGPDEQLQFIVTMTANAVGRATFIGDPADISPLHDSLTFEPARTVGIDFLRFGNDSLNITSTGSLGGGEFTNPRERHDVNADGHVSPLDALLIIKQLSGGGAGALGEGESPTSRLYVDVNGDRNLSPLDVLFVISFLNKSFGSATGEGEGFAAPPVTHESATDTVLGSDLNDDLLAQLAVDIELNKKKR
jgi:large repetitive protein